MNAVGGHRNKPSRTAAERIHRAYRAPCAQFADDLGWPRDTIAEYFEQMQFMRMREQGWPRELAAWMAMRDLHAVFWKPGAIGD